LGTNVNSGEQKNLSQQTWPNSISNGALSVALTSNLLHAEARRTSSPGEALRRVHERLLEINDTGMFVTLFYGVLNSATGELRYARAGHELPLVYDARGRLLKIPFANGQPLGALDSILLDEQTVMLPLGSTVLFYTDGVTDALDSKSKPFGRERLRKALRARRNASAQSLCDELLETTAAHGAHTPQFDDITLVAVQVKQWLTALLPVKHACRSTKKES
jgi:phosphoserine phosphatase RsbU/P